MSTAKAPLSEPTAPLVVIGAVHCDGPGFVRFVSRRPSRLGRAAGTTWVLVVDGGQPVSSVHFDWLLFAGQTRGDDGSSIVGVSIARPPASSSERGSVPPTSCDAGAVIADAFTTAQFGPSSEQRHADGVVAGDDSERAREDGPVVDRLEPWRLAATVVPFTCHFEHGASSRSPQAAVVELSGLSLQRP